MGIEGQWSRGVHEKIRYYRWDMRILPAHIIQAPIDAHQGTRSHITDESIVFDWEVAYREAEVSDIFTTGGRS